MVEARVGWGVTAMFKQQNDDGQHEHASGDVERRLTIIVRDLQHL
jgi:hypothetical protein